MKICAESLPGKPRGMLMLRKVFSILVLCIVCTAFADGQDERMNYIRHHGGCERCALTTCSKCPTVFHGTKPLEPLKNGLPAFWPYLQRVSNRHPAGVYFSGIVENKGSKILAFCKKQIIRIIIHTLY